MIKNNEPFLIEYNVRMGDPECQTIMTRLESDLLDIVNYTIDNKLNEIKINWKREKSLCIVLCSKGYPDKYKKDTDIFSNGGRVLNVISISNNLRNARDKVIFNLNKLNWRDGFFRKDIGWRSIKNK